MAKEMTSNAVSILPPTSGIKDGPTRGFLDALTNLLDARSGYTNKDAPERFITAAEFEGLANRALVQAFSSGGISSGSGSGTSVPSAKEVNDAIDNLADFIRRSLIYQKLGEQIDLIDISSLRERVRELGTGIFREETVREEEDLRLASLIFALQAGLYNAAAGITEELEVRVTRDLALAKAINTIWASVGGSEAVIQDGALSSATPNSAQATKWTQVQAAVTDPNTGQVSSTAILQESRSYASNADGKFNSIYSVRAQVSTGGRTIVGGFGVSATNGAGSGSGPTIDFGVRADTFFIAATTETPDAATQINQGSAIPFMVLTRNQVVNGVTYTPGVYIKKAVIGSATIGEAQIADLAVTTAKIKEASIDTLRVQGNAITGLAFGEGGAGTLAAGGSEYVASAALNMPSGASGCLATVFINMAGAGGGATIYISVVRNGVELRLVQVSVTDGFFNTFTVPVFDPSPAPGFNSYSFLIKNPSTAGPGSNRAVWFNTPAIVVSGAKR